jgi:hypothetical protein
VPDSHDPLRALFKEAAATGQTRARSVPVSAVAARGRTRQVWHAAGAAAACVVLASAGLTAAELLSGGAHATNPASTTPLTSWPTHTVRGPSPTASDTRPPTDGSTSTSPSTSGAPFGGTVGGTPTWPPGTTTRPGTAAYPASTSPPTRTTPPRTTKPSTTP